MTANLFDILDERGFVAQSTDAHMRERLAKPVVAYVGFDPTADSLHLGHLVPIMGLRWMQHCGHTPLILVGGATALVGDPSGKSETRRMLSREEIDRNVAAIAAQIGRIVRIGGEPGQARLVNNADWLAGLGWIELLREAGPHFSVNRMLSMDSVKGRLESGGISFLEFNYMVMQAYDFLHLHRSLGCSVQMGGADQWGNIVMGIELGRRKADYDLAGMTFPLVTKADGGKFGKSEKGTVWLAQERTSVYDFYQFWRNSADADTAKFLRFFTVLPVAEIDALAAGDINRAKEVLALEATALVHGLPAAEQALADARRAFGAARDVGGDSIPHSDLPSGELDAGISLVALLVRAGLAASNGEARRLIGGGGVRVHDIQVDDPQRKLGPSDAQAGVVLLRAGKKRLFRFDVH
jgi:tyrosyl-tRNA synthetase